MAEIPLVEKAEPVKRIRIRWVQSESFEKVFFRKGPLVERDSFPKGQDEIECYP
jgi:hypothetical protein